MSGESQNVLRSKTTNRQTASKLRLLMLLYQGWYLHKEKETSFLTLFMANFGQTATSLFEIQTPAWNSASKQSVSRRNFFLFSTEWYSFFLLWACFFSFFLFFLSRTFFRFRIFHEQRSFHSKKLSRVSFVECAM